MTDTTRTFGSLLLEALRWQAGGERIVGRLNYAQIQQLKAADRAGVQALFKGTTDYAAIQHIKRDSPEDLAEYLVRRATPDATGADTAAALIFLGFLLSD